MQPWRYDRVCMLPHCSQLRRTHAGWLSAATSLPLLPVAFVRVSSPDPGRGNDEGGRHPRSETRRAQLAAVAGATREDGRTAHRAAPQPPPPGSQASGVVPPLSLLSLLLNRTRGRWCGGRSRTRRQEFQSGRSRGSVGRDATQRPHAACRCSAWLTRACELSSRLTERSSLMPCLSPSRSGLRGHSVRLLLLLQEGPALAL